MPTPTQTKQTEPLGRALLGNPRGELRYVILAAQREGNRILAQQLAPFQVTPSQAEVLIVLFQHGPLTLKGLGSLIVCETGSPSRLVDALVKRDLVERTENPADRREVLLQLSADGEQIGPKLIEIEHELDKKLSEIFTAEQQHTVSQGLRRFLVGSRSIEAIEGRFPAPSPRS